MDRLTTRIVVLCRPHAFLSSHTGRLLNGHHLRNRGRVVCLYVVDQGSTTEAIGFTPMLDNGLTSPPQPGLAVDVPGMSAPQNGLVETGVKPVFVARTIQEQL